MNQKIINQTLKTIETYLQKDRKAYFGMMQGVIQGGFSMINSAGRLYLELICVDPGLQRLFLDLYPQSHCEEPYRNTLNSYLSSKMGEMRSGKITIDDSTGCVKIRVESVIATNAPGYDDLHAMEVIALLISDDVEKTVDRICHGQLVFEDKDELKGALTKERNELLDKLAKARMKTNAQNGEDEDDYDEDDYDIDDDEDDYDIEDDDDTKRANFDAIEVLQELLARRREAQNADTADSDSDTTNEDKDEAPTLEGERAE